MTIISDTIEDAEIIEETARPNIEPAAASAELTNTEAEVKEEKPATFKIAANSVFTPPPVVFLGSNPEANYHTWLTRHFKEVISGLGRKKKSDGSYPKAYAHAVNFIRSAVVMLRFHREHAKIKYETPTFPRPINQVAVILDVLNSNKELINAIAPMYDPISKKAADDLAAAAGSKDSAESTLSPEDKASLQASLTGMLSSSGDTADQAKTPSTPGMAAGFNVSAGALSPEDHGSLMAAFNAARAAEAAQAPLAVPEAQVAP